MGNDYNDHKYIFSQTGGIGVPKSYSEQERAYIRERLKEEAADCLATYGVRRTTVDEIVRRVNIPKGTFYLFYQSEYSRKLAALENTAFPEHSVFSSPPLFSGFLTCFLYFHQEILKYLLTNLPVCAAAFID